MDWLWPAECGGCGTVGDGWFCTRCRAYGATRLDRLAPTLDGLFAVAPYASGFGRAIAASKSKAQRGLARLVAVAWARRVAPFVQQFELIVPAPSTRASLARRGFSVASLLAEALSLSSGVPYNQALQVSPGKQQARLDRDQRRTNLQGRVRCQVHVPKRVLWVDDVVTTGGSAQACATALRSKGAEEVWGAVACVTLEQPRRLESWEARGVLMRYKTSSLPSLPPSRPTSCPPR